MKRKLILLLLFLILVSGCGVNVAEADKLAWTIIKSPITGRYYEVATFIDGYQGFQSMSEVTKLEYDAYILSKG